MMTCLETGWPPMIFRVTAKFPRCAIFFQKDPLCDLWPNLFRLSSLFAIFFSKTPLCESLLRSCGCLAFKPSIRGRCSKQCFTQLWIWTKI